MPCLASRHPIPRLYYGSFLHQILDNNEQHAIPQVNTFQGLILALQNYWAQQGCVILQPYDMEMGAGTFHTATFLRALGPETWNAAYVQPSRRPADGRYGENPNRLQHYYQFQVVLKPNPDNIQELYLNSLKHILTQQYMTFVLSKITGNHRHLAHGV